MAISMKKKDREQLLKGINASIKKINQMQKSLQLRYALTSSKKMHAEISATYEELTEIKQHINSIKETFDYKQINIPWGIEDYRRHLEHSNPSIIILSIKDGYANLYCQRCGTFFSRRVHNLKYTLMAGRHVVCLNCESKRKHAPKKNFKMATVPDLIRLAQENRGRVFNLKVPNMPEVEVKISA